MVSALKFGLLGHPVGHSVSPAIHQAAYDVFGLPHIYAVCDCPGVADVERQVDALRNHEWAGLNVTVPWKRLALKLADDLDSSARQTGAANVLVRQISGKVRAYNTDAPALGNLLAANTESGGPQTALVLGNGGAALAAVVAARSAGSERVFVSARRWLPETPEWESRAQFESLGAIPVAWTQTAIAEIASQLTLLVQATSAGMRGAAPGDGVAAIVPWSRLPPTAFAYDVVYNPASTPFLDSARQAGIRAEGGLSMLVGQAALAIELWLGVNPPLAPLMDRARTAVYGHGDPHR